jgi:hypothetical protein
LQEVFLPKETHCSHVNNEQDALLLAQMVFFWQIHMFRQLSWIGLLTTKWAIIYIEKCDEKEVFLQERSQFSQGNSVLDVSASHTDCILLKNACVSSTYLNRPIWKKMSLSPPWKV